MRTLFSIAFFCAICITSGLPALPPRPNYAIGRSRLTRRPEPAPSSPVNDQVGVEDADSEFNADSLNLDDREQLYSAYNALHSLAQDFKKPFDSPAVLVVGHQTSGKSALLEALMGFQFNQVGGGTKTRRPVALRMQYNPDCKNPVCFLTLENGKEEQRSLEDIQAYIEAENKRLEMDATRCYDAREINIRVEYKYCPNMIVIDTPGMLHAPKGTRLTPQQRALALAAKEAETLVLNKMRVEDYIILCVEDTTDWKHATTRNIVQQVDPLLSRTVLVSTKLDTKLPQFSDGADLEDFLRAPLIEKLYPRALGGPYYTSVPCGRVGPGKEFETNDAFVENMRRAEEEDIRLASVQLGQSLSQSRISSSLKNVGISRLRTFLEEQIEMNYRRNVAKILPLLQSELQKAELKLAETDSELNSLSLERLRVGANTFREKFARELTNVIHGTAKASPEDCGETLDTEQLRGGAFLAETHLRSDAWKKILDNEVGNAKHKLFGGAQYHRAVREFTTAVRHMPAPPVTEDEIANAAGMGDMHDGVNFMRAACVLAMQKAQSTFEPLLEAMKLRSTYIMGRLHNVVSDIVVATDKHGGVATSVDAISQSSVFREVIHKIFDQFVQQQIENCLEKCRDDLQGMTRFVTWDVDGKSGSSSLYRSLPTPQKMVEIYSVALENSRIPGGDSRTRRKGRASRGDKDDSLSSSSELVDPPKRSSAWRMPWVSTLGRKRAIGNQSRRKINMDVVMKDWDSANRMEPEADLERYESSGVTTTKTDVMVPDHYELLQLTEEMLAGRDANRTSTVISALVQFIVKSWQDHFARTVAMKFNCFFLLPFIDEFPQYLRDELDKMYRSIDDKETFSDNDRYSANSRQRSKGFSMLFDVGEARAALIARRNELAAECDANSKLQARFDAINAKMQARGGSHRSHDSSSDNVGKH